MLIIIYPTQKKCLRVFLYTFGMKICYLKSNNQEIAKPNQHQPHLPYQYSWIITEKVVQSMVYLHLIFLGDSYYLIAYMHIDEFLAKYSCNTYFWLALN